MALTKQLSNTLRQDQRQAPVARDHGREGSTRALESHDKMQFGCVIIH